jgi:uncharacterized SAM-binding protein YcdF (DUF218 family)
MLFIIKKWLGSLLMPLPLLLFIFFIGLILLCFTKKQKTAKAFLICSFVFLFLFSLMPISEQIIRSIERKHPPIMQSQAAQQFDYILLLGSAGIADPTLPVTGQLSATALSRFMEALRLYHANPNAKLVLSGAKFGDLKSHAQLMEELALSMDIEADKIIRLDDTRDSDDEARQMSAIIHGKKSALVTSASHMDRALQLFSRYGTAPTPAPANYLAKVRSGETPGYYYIPSSYQLYKTKLAWHEYLGRLHNLIKQLL